MRVEEPTSRPAHADWEPEAASDELDVCEDEASELEVAETALTRRSGDVAARCAAAVGAGVLAESCRPEGVCSGMYAVGLEMDMGFREG